MRRFLIWLPLLLTACNGNLLGPETTLGGPLGRFGHSLSRLPATPAPVVATPAPEVAALPVETPAPRQLVATPVPFVPAPVRTTPSPTPVPTPTPYVPVVLLTPAPSPWPVPGLTDVTVNQRRFTFTVWDDAYEDGDRIRLYLNGQVLEAAVDLTLKNAGTRLTVDLQPGINRLRFLALNTGESPPNTFALKVDADLLISGSASQVSRGLEVGESDTLTVTAP